MKTRESILAREGILGPTTLIEQVVFSHIFRDFGSFGGFYTICVYTTFSEIRNQQGGIGENVKATASAITVKIEISKHLIK